MKINHTWVAGVLVGTIFAALAVAKEKKPKPGPLTGTWDCISHGAPQGDMPFTLHLEQAKEKLTGSVESPIGGTEITTGQFKKKTLDIRLDTPQANYRLTAKLKKKHLAGEWSVENGPKGTWEGKRSAESKR